MPYGAAAVLGGAGLLGSIFGGIISSNAAQNAARLQSQASNRAIDAQQNEFDQIQRNLLPFLEGGQGASALLQALFGVNTAANNFGANFGPVEGTFLQSPTATLGAPPAFGTPPTYNMPPFTQAQFQQSPGYQYELGQQQQAIQNSAAGKVGAISGNTFAALQGNAQGLASQDWWNAYNAYTQNYGNQYNSQAQNFLNAFNANNQNYWNQFNAINNQRGQISNVLSSLAGQGLGGANTTAQGGLATGQGIANSLIGQGNALAAGSVGSANALTGGINSGLTSALIALLGNPQANNQPNMLNWLLGNNASTGGVGTGGWIPTA